MIVIDIGAHDGTAFALPYSENPDITVYAIEPNPQLVAKLQLHPRPNLHVRGIAVGDHDGTVPFHLNRDDQTSSLLSAHCQGDWEKFAPQLDTVATIDVPLKRLDTFFAEEGITEVELLKIDAQGFDLQVLQGAGEAIHSVRKILVEVQLQPLYAGSGSKAEVVEYLGERGFELIRSRPQTDGLEENLEFVRYSRYRQAPTGAEFTVTLPYVGALQMPRYDHVGRLLEQGTFEFWEQAFLWLYLREGDTFFDCGTHAGLFSAVAARCVGETGRVVGFEPNPVCVDLYRRNLVEGGCGTVQAVNVGLAEADGSAQLLLGRQGMAAFSSLAVGAKDHAQIGEDTVPVTLRSLDGLVAELGVAQVALAKLDVEGWEGFALAGAKQAIAAGKFPVWMVEFTDANAAAAGTSTAELWQQLEALGYQLCRFDVSRLQLVPERPKQRYPYDNLFAVQDLAAVNARLAAASPERRTTAQDVISRCDTAMAWQSLLRQFAQLQDAYEGAAPAAPPAPAAVATENPELQAENQWLRQSHAQLSDEVARLSSGRGALRQLIKTGLKRVGLYSFVYARARTAVPVYNRLFRDSWQPATLAPPNSQREP